MMKIKKKYIASIFLTFVLGTILGLIVSNYKYFLPNSITELHSGGYALINPLYECVESDNVAGDFSALEKKIVDYVNEVISSEDVDRTSVYFKDLNNGPWFGTNYKANFSPASLLKVPVMIAYFKKAQDNPKILNKKLKFTQEIYTNIQPITDPTNPIKIGNEYTVEQLIEKMIIESDNNALILLKENISQSDIDKVSKDLGVPTSRSINNFMSVKDYSSFFRILYNSSYLNTTYSQKALAILLKTNFTEGIRKPLPKNIRVADKFGERYIEGNIKYQLHNCGIIYYPDRPYLLCVMTEGKDYERLKKMLQEISQLIYHDYNSLFGRH